MSGEPTQMFQCSENPLKLYEVSQGSPIPSRTQCPAAMYAANLISFEALQVYPDTSKLSLEVPTHSKGVGEISRVL